MQQSRRDSTITLLFALAYGLLLFALAWSRYATCHNQTFDLALYTRTAWGLARGDFWNPIADTTFIHLHAAWILLPLGLIGRAFGAHATVPVLLVAQSLAIAACIWPLTRIATRHLGQVGIWVAPLLWIAYPNLGHVGSYEFHPGTLALLPMCWALDALDRNDGRALTWSCIGVLLCRADYALLTIAMGVLLATSNAHEQRKSGRSIAASSLGYLLLVLAVQRLNPTHGITSAQLHFGAWGGSPLGIVPTLFTDPLRVWNHLIGFDRLSYLPRVFLPLALLPLLSARWLWIALPIVALNLISAWPTATRLDSHYLTPAVPVLLVSAMVGAARLPERVRWLWLAIPIVTSAWLGGLPWSLDFHANEFRADAHTLACATVARRIPTDAPVQAPDPLLPHMAERAVILRGPPPERGAQLVVLDTSHRDRFSQQEDLLRTREEPLLRTWLARTDHAVIHATPTLLLLSRGHDPRTGWSKRYFRKPLTNVRPIDRGTRLTDCLTVESASRIGTNLRLDLRADRPCPLDLAIRIGTNAKPRRVDLLFDGLLSPAQLRRGDLLTSTHPLTGTEAATIGKSGLWLGALRSSGAPPHPNDPIARRIPLQIAP